MVSISVFVIVIIIIKNARVKSAGVPFTDMEIL